MNTVVLRFASRALQRAPGLYQPLSPSYPCRCPDKRLFSRPSVLPTSMTSHKANGGKAAMAKELHERLIWVDCEMTGLDIDKDHLLEIACLITDGELNVVAEVRRRYALVWYTIVKSYKGNFTKCDIN